MKKSEKSIKTFAPEGGWNAENFQKHGKTLVANFIRVQRNQRKRNKGRLKRFLRTLFRSQIEEVIKVADKASGFKSFTKAGNEWETALSGVFGTGGQSYQVAGNMNAIQEQLVQGAYKDTKKLLGDKPQRRGFYENKDRTNKIAGRVTKINNTTRNILRGEILNSLKNGDTITETTRRLRGLLPRMNRRIPTIVRTEMGRATDEGVKQSMKESRTVTHSSVVGCEKEELTFTYNGASTCNVEDVPVSEVDSIDFHINHTGAWVPSKFKSREQIAKESLRDEERLLAKNPAKFPSKPRSASRDSMDSHTKAGIFNEDRRLVHSNIKNQITGNQSNLGWQGDKAIVLMGGGMMIGNELRRERAFKENNPEGRISGSAEIDTEWMIEEFPEYDPMQKSSRMGSFEQSDSYLFKECGFLKQELLEEIIALGMTSLVGGVGAGHSDHYKPFYENLKGGGHALEGHFQVGDMSEAITKNVRIGSRLGYMIPNYCIERSVEGCCDYLMRQVEKGMFSRFFLYRKGEVIFKYEEGKASILDFGEYENFITGSRLANWKMINKENLPFLPFGKIIREPDIDIARDTFDLPDAREAQVMATEIITGGDIEDSDLQPMSEDYIEAWKTIESQIAEIESAGLRLAFRSYVES